MCILLIVLLLSGGLCFALPKETRAAEKSRWSALKDKYREKKNTDRLIFVKYTGGTSCHV